MHIMQLEYPGRGGNDNGLFNSFLIVSRLGFKMWLDVSYS